MNQDKQAPKTTIMVDEFKKGRKKAAPAAEQDGDLLLSVLCWSTCV